MKRILIFIGLKILELAGFAALNIGIYYLGSWNPFSFSPDIHYKIWTSWGFGLIYLGVLGIVIVILYGLKEAIVSIIETNWELSEKLNNRISKPSSEPGEILVDSGRKRISKRKWDKAVREIDARNKKK